MLPSEIQLRIPSLITDDYVESALYNLEIARKLNVSEPTVSRDIQFLNRQAQENLRIHVERRIYINAKISDKFAALHVILTTYDKISEVLLGEPTLNELIKRFKLKQEQLQEAANEIQREREKDRERKRLGLTIEEYEATLMETEDRNRVA